MAFHRQRAGPSALAQRAIASRTLETIPRNLAIAASQSSVISTIFIPSRSSEPHHALSSRFAFKDAALRAQSSPYLIGYGPHAHIY